MSKQCVHCGAQLHEEASFCTHCARSQIEKKELPVPKLKRRTLPWLILLILLGFSVVLLMKQPQTVEELPAIEEELHITQHFESENALLNYKDEDGEYVLFLSDSPRQAMHEFESAIAADSYAMFYSNLYVKQNDEIVSLPFMEKVESCTVESIPQGNSVKLAEHFFGYDEQHIDTAMTAHMMFSSECTHNILKWTLVMKNGDTLSLQQDWKINELPTMEYSWEEYPMNTMEELQALMAQIEQEVDAETVVELHLPAVIYEGELKLENRTYNFYGSINGSLQTTFSDTLTVCSEEGSTTSFENICFEGSGGTGLHCTDGAKVYNCTFRGWDVGAHADGGWIMCQNCQYLNNDIGLLIDCSDGFRSFGPDLEYNQFSGNRIGALVKDLYGTRVFNFRMSYFKDNEVDVENHIAERLDLSEAVFFGS